MHTLARRAVDQRRQARLLVRWAQTLVRAARHVGAEHEAGRTLRGRGTQLLHRGAGAVGTRHVRRRTATRRGEQRRAVAGQRDAPLVAGGDEAWRTGDGGGAGQRRHGGAGAVAAADGFGQRAGNGGDAVVHRLATGASFAANEAGRTANGCGAEVVARHAGEAIGAEERLVWRARRRRNEVAVLLRHAAALQVAAQHHARGARENRGTLRRVLHAVVVRAQRVVRRTQRRQRAVGVVAVALSRDAGGGRARALQRGRQRAAAPRLVAPVAPAVRLVLLAAVRLHQSHAAAARRAHAVEDEVARRRLALAGVVEAGEVGGGVLRTSVTADGQSEGVERQRGLRAPSHDDRHDHGALLQEEESSGEGREPLRQRALARRLQDLRGLPHRVPVAVAVHRIDDQHYLHVAVLATQHVPVSVRHNHLHLQSVFEEPLRGGRSTHHGRFDGDGPEGDIRLVSLLQNHVHVVALHLNHRVSGDQRGNGHSIHALAHVLHVERLLHHSGVVVRVEHVSHLLVRARVVRVVLQGEAVLVAQRALHQHGRCRGRVGAERLRHGDHSGVESGLQRRLQRHEQSSEEHVDGVLSECGLKRQYGNE